MIVTSVYAYIYMYTISDYLLYLMDIMIYHLYNHGGCTIMWIKQCHKPPMTGNGNHTTFKNGDNWGMVYWCFNHIIGSQGGYNRDCVLLEAIEPTEV